MRKRRGAMHLSSCLCKNGMIRARPNKRMQLARLRRDGGYGDW
jgi:hypothetical protein